MIQKLLLASTLVLGWQHGLFTCAQTCPPASNVDILIIGAGMSGASAAEVLAAKQGTVSSAYTWAWVEAYGTAGGRMRDTVFGSQNTLIEEGASWIQGGAGNPVYEMAVGQIDFYVQDYDNIDTYNNGVEIDIDTTFEAFDTAYICMQRYAEDAFVNNQTEELLQGESIRERLAICGWLNPPTELIDRMVEWYTIDYESALTAESSSLFGAFPQYTYIFYDDVDYFVHDQAGGFNQIVDNMISGIPTQNRPYFNVRVDNIDTTSEALGALVSMTLINRNGADTTCTPIRARKVISTVSIGVLEEAGDTWLTPSFPSDKRDAMNRVYEMALYYKFFFEFTEASWESTFGGTGGPNANFEFLEIANAFGTNCHHWQNLDTPDNVFVPGSRIMFCTMTTEALETVIIQPNLNSDAIRDLIFTPLQGIFPDLIVQNFYYTDWKNDPYTFGSKEMWLTPGLWSDYETFKAPITYSNSNENAVFISGSASCGNFFGYVHGAWHAGNLQANLVLADMGYATSWSLICDYIIGTRDENEWEWETGGGGGGGGGGRDGGGGGGGGGGQSSRNNHAKEHLQKGQDEQAALEAKLLKLKEDIARRQQEAEELEAAASKSTGNKRKGDSDGGGQKRMKGDD
mmetsp:Transcript_2135/g.3271  ORF Transcript_2135/g.3271 Transcript_2135/m.3271 type:complete len:629 (-) Transcript_2135:150-2036(-)